MNPDGAALEEGPQQDLLQIDMALDHAPVEEALRQTGSKQQSLSGLLSALTWWTDADGSRVAVDAQWAAYTGQHVVDARQFRWLDAAHPDDIESTRAAFRHAFASGEVLERQQRIRQANGSYRWHLLRHVPVVDATGVLSGWFGVAMDVHELHELQQRQSFLLQLNDMLRSAIDAEEAQHRAMHMLAAHLEATKAEWFEVDAHEEFPREDLRASKGWSFALLQSSCFGLKLSRTLARQLGGEIRFHSDHGTTVEVAFPATELKRQAQVRSKNAADTHRRFG